MRGHAAMRTRMKIAAALLGALALGGCVDLAVTNPNDPDAERALATPGDVEALISGSFQTWWYISSSYNSVPPILATVSYSHSATAANFGMVEFSGWPKVPVHNAVTNTYYSYFNNPWVRAYRAVSAVVDGLTAINEGFVELPPADADRAQAFGYYILGVSHGVAALLYDQAYVFDPSIDRAEVTLRPYDEVMEAALGYLDEAIARSQGKSFTIPATWISHETSPAQLARMAHSMKARFRAAVARTPAERAAVDWDAVIQDVDQGVTETWYIDLATSNPFQTSFLTNLHRFGAWGQLSYQVLGMADQSGKYQQWIARPALDRHPNMSADQTSDPFLIITPDTRFPQGTTLATQQGKANAGEYFEIPTQSGGYGAQWNRPDRGTFRWSYYRYWANDAWLTARGDYPEITREEMDLLKAEALFRKGDRGGAAVLVNKTRTKHGLNATDAAGTNTSCVPKLPNGQCGDLFEMLKWEVRLETFFRGTLMASWYFHGRGWGDLAEGTFLQLPVPGGEAELIPITSYTFGGPGGESSAPTGTYGY